MGIHFASSHAIDFFKLGGSVRTASIPAAFDASYVVQTLLCQSNTPCWRQTIPSAVQSDFYWQGKVYQTSVFSSGTPLVQFSSTVATVMTNRFRLIYTGSTTGTIKVQWNNAGTWTDFGSTLALASSTLYTLTFRFKFHASAGEISFWVNNALIASLTGNTTTYGSLIDTVDLSNPSITSGTNGDTDWAEIIVTTNEHPYLFRVKTHVLQAASDYGNSGWTGAYTDVDEPDPSSSDILSAATAGLCSTFRVDDLPALGALVVRAIQVSAMARRGATGPQNLQLTLRASGVNQLSPVKALNTGYNDAYHVYETNSVTGAEFTKAEIDASEPGVTSVT